MLPIQAMFQPTLLLKNVSADPDAARFKLKAAQTNFLANMLGLGTTVTLTVDPSGVRIRKSTFSSEESTFVPRSQIASSVYVTAKPIELLILGIITLVMIVGLFLIIYYFMARRRVILGVISSGGTVESLKLRATDDELDEVAEGMAILEGLLAGTAHEPAAPSLKNGPVAPPVRQPARETRPVDCPSCGSRLKLPVAAVGQKVRCSNCQEVFLVPAD